jgi:signal transduction histidine kinase
MGTPDGRDGLDRLIAAEQDERRRLALFLHDGAVQQLSGIALMLDGALHAIASGRPEEARQIIGLALDRQRETIRELRDLSFALEPVVLRDQGFAPALRALADQASAAHGLEIDLDVGAASVLGETAQVALYTIVRELLDQSVRRGPPRRIRIAVTRSEDGGVTTTVSDDAEPERRQRTFEAIEERVLQLHGEINVGPGSEGGTEVRVSLPRYTAQR